jgi:hypothetical protein
MSLETVWSPSGPDRHDCELGHDHDCQSSEGEGDDQRLRGKSPSVETYSMKIVLHDGVRRDRAEQPFA